MFSSFMHPGKQYDAQREQLEKYYGQAQAALQPYQQQGQDSYAPLSGAMGQLLDPQKLQEQWGQGYEQSPYATDLMNTAQEQGLGAASSMGLMGSSTALRGIEGKAGQIASADKQQYMDNLMQKYLAGAGIAQNIYGTGAQAAGAASGQSMQMGDAMGVNAANRAGAGGRLFGSMLGTAAGLAGTALGGPLGGMAAKSMFG